MHELSITQEILNITLEKARDIGRAEGLKYVYAGNMPGHSYENTFCPRCNRSLIERYGFTITKNEITLDKRCPYCGEEIPIIGELTPLVQRVSQQGMECFNDRLHRKSNKASR